MLAICEKVCYNGYNGGNGRKYRFFGGSYETCNFNG